MSKRKHKRTSDYAALGEFLFPPHKVAAYKEYKRLNLSPEQARLTYGDDFISFFGYMEKLDAFVVQMVQAVRKVGLSADEAVEALRMFGGGADE